MVRQPLAKDPEGCRGYHQVHRGGAQEERAEVRGCGGRDQDHGGGGGRRSTEPARRAQVPQDAPRGESAWSAASVFSRHPPSLSAHRGEASNARVSRGFDALRSPSPHPHPICPPSLLHRRLLPDPPPPRVIAPRVYDSSRLTPLPPLPDVAGRRRGCPRARAGEARRVFQRDPGCRGGARRRRRRVSRPLRRHPSRESFSFRSPRREVRFRRRAEGSARARGGGETRRGGTRQLHQGAQPHQPPLQAQAHPRGGGGTAQTPGGVQAARRRRDDTTQLSQSARDPPRRRSRRGASTKNSRGVRLRHQDGGVLRPPVRRAHLFRSISRGGVWREKSGVRGDDGDGVRRVVSRSRALSPRPRLRALRHRVQTRGWRRVRAPRAESRAGRSRGGVGIGTLGGDDGVGPNARRVAVRRLREGRRREDRR